MSPETIKCHEIAEQSLYGCESACFGDIDCIRKCVDTYEDGLELCPCGAKCLEGCPCIDCDDCWICKDTCEVPENNENAKTVIPAILSKAEFDPR